MSETAAERLAVRPELKLDIIKAHASRAHQLELARYALQTGLRHAEVARIRTDAIAETLASVVAARDVEFHALNLEYGMLTSKSATMTAEGYLDDSDLNFNQQRVFGDAPFCGFKPIRAHGAGIGFDGGIRLGKIWVPYDLLTELQPSN